MVLSRCAIVKTVECWNSRRIVSCIRASVARSTAAVASSSTSTLERRRRALAKHNSCLCPMLNSERLPKNLASHALMLPNVIASFADTMIEPIRKCGHEWLQMGKLQHLPQLTVVVFIKGVQVEAEGA